MEFQEFWRIRERMHKYYYYLTCCNCPLSKLPSISHHTCLVAIVEDRDKAEEIAKKWAEEHPIITNADKFYEINGNGQIDE